jgi:hypothetical protein
MSPETFMPDVKDEMGAEKLREGMQTENVGKDDPSYLLSHWHLPEIGSDAQTLKLT